MGLIGGDQAAEKLLSELRRVGIDTTGVVIDDARPTTTKTRIMAEGSLRFPQQLARIDHVDRHAVSGEIETQLVSQVEKLTRTMDAVLVSDYQTGVTSEAIIAAALRVARAHGKLCTVDAQGSFPKYAGFDLIKGNRQEIETFLGCTLEDEDDYRAAGARLTSQLDANAVIITRGADGMSWIARDGGYGHVPAANRSEVFDVTGAGDTVLAVATLALAAGLGLTDAAQLANYAAGWVVRKLGNAVATLDELKWAVKTW